MSLGKKVLEYRKNKGLSQKDLSKLTGISQTYISKIEDEQREITVTKAVKLSKALNVSILDLLSEELEKYQVN